MMSELVVGSFPVAGECVLPWPELCFQSVFLMFYHIILIFMLCQCCLVGNMFTVAVHKCTLSHTITTNTHLTALFRDYPGEPVPER